MKKSEIFFGLLKIPVDFIAVAIGFLIAYKLRLITDEIPGIAKPIDYTVLPTAKEYLNFSLYFALAMLIIFIIGRMYSLKSTFKLSKEIKKTLILGLIWVMLCITYFFFSRTFPFSRLAIVYSWGIAIIMVLLGKIAVRIIQKIAMKYGIGKRNLLIIGNNPISQTFMDSLIKDPSYRIIGIIDNEKSEYKGVKVIGGSTQFDYITKKENIEEIIQTSEIIESRKILDFCNENHVEYTFVPDLLEVQRTNIEVKVIGSIPTISLKKTPLDGWGKVAKRTMDILGATFGLAIISPIMIVTAIAIKINSKGPILFTKLDNGQPVKRVGQHGELFKCYKFRSMRPNTHNMRYSKELSEMNVRKGGPLVKIQNDPRVTKVGNFIRKYSIDELPQLWNVLIGNMSLVGPRPHLPEEVAKYKGHHKFVLAIKPGMTGLPQISGRSDLDFETEVKLDRYYIENWSIWFDIKLIFKTIFILVKGYKE